MCTIYRKKETYMSNSPSSSSSSFPWSCSCAHHPRPRHTRVLSAADFRPLRVLGKGGHGTVYLAADAARAGRRVALKVVAKSGLRTREYPAVFGEQAVSRALTVGAREGAGDATCPSSTSGLCVAGGGREGSARRRTRLFACALDDVTVNMCVLTRRRRRGFPRLCLFLLPWAPPERVEDREEGDEAGYDADAETGKTLDDFAEPHGRLGKAGKRAARGGWA